MSDTFTFSIDGVEIKARLGQTILEAADEAGIYIPRLCHHPAIPPNGSCRVCTVMINGRPQTACTTPAHVGMVVENDTPELASIRANLIEMLFVDGNHFCMFCEKSGNCELQAIAYRFGIMAMKYPFLNPDREVDASHPDILFDRNRCIFCGRCIRASRELDGKNAFQYVGRTDDKKVGVNAASGALADTDVEATDRAIELCPVGALLRKHIGYRVPIGERTYDHEPIGAEIEANKKA